MTKKPAVQTKAVPSTAETELAILESEFARVKQALRAKREELAPKSTVEDAFGYEQTDRPENVRKGLLSIAYLLDSLSSIGNEEVEGPMCNGFAYALRHYASNVEAYLKPKGVGYNVGHNDAD